MSSSIPTLARFQEEVERADPAALLMSLRDCHSRQVSSIVLRNDGGRLLRVFMAWPHHDLDYNEDRDARGAFSVGVHDHRSDVKLRAICGEPRSSLYVTSEGFRGIRIREIEFRSRILYGKEPIVIVGDRYIQRRSQCIIPGNRWLRLGARDLHTVSVPRGARAAWYLQEGVATRDVTRLFTNSTVDTAGMYRKFETADHVIEHVRKFVREASS